MSVGCALDAGTLASCTVKAYGGTRLVGTTKQAFSSGPTGTVKIKITKTWKVRRVALIGYSFGADALPAAYNQLAPAEKNRVSLISLLALSSSAEFEFDVKALQTMLSHAGYDVGKVDGLR